MYVQLISTESAYYRAESIKHHRSYYYLFDSNEETGNVALCVPPLSILFHPARTFFDWNPPHRTSSCAKDYWRKLKKGNRTLALNKTKHTHPRYETNVPRFSMLTGGISLFCKRRRMRKGVHQTTLYTDCDCFRCRYTKDAGKSVIALHHHHLHRYRFATALGRL